MMHREELLRSVAEIVRLRDNAAFAALAAERHPSDLAEALAALEPGAIAPLLTALPTELLSRIFVYFSTEEQNALLRALPYDAVIALFEFMAADDRADLFNRLDTAARDRLLAALAQGERGDILRLSSYPEGSVGSVTTSDYVSVRPDMSVAEALAHVRGIAADRETVYVLYAQDAEGRLCGTLSLRELLLAAACAAVTYKQHYTGRKPDKALHFINNVRFGQTEQGSFVLQLLSPVTIKNERDSLYIKRVVPTLQYMLEHIDGDICKRLPFLESSLNTDIYNILVDMYDSIGDCCIGIEIAYSGMREEKRPRYITYINQLTINRTKEFIEELSFKNKMIHDFKQILIINYYIHSLSLIS